jgi:UDP:flavonoid glycosyltransferase YjiC (YdhE family)
MSSGHGVTMNNVRDLIPAGTRRIDLLAPPFAGHLHPILALACVLRAHYQVRVISTESMLPRIRAAGLEAHELLAGQEQALLAIANPQYAVGNHPLRLYRQFRAALALLADFRSELDALYRQSAPDLAIADFTLPIVGCVAQDRGIRWWTSLPSPCVLETPDGPPAYFGGLFPARTRWQQSRHALARYKLRLFKKTIFALFRRPIQALGMKQLYRDDGSESAYSAECILALGDPALEFPRRWPSAVKFIGPALYTPHYDLPAPPFKCGQRHVLVTLGTHLAWHKQPTINALAQLAATLPEWQFHFTWGDPETHGTAPVQANLVCLAWIDYERDLEHYDVVIHHGGAGIMYYCLRHDIPALIYPVDYDQFDHAARIEAAGKGIWLRGGLSALRDARPLLEQLVS